MKAPALLLLLLVAACAGVPKEKRVNEASLGGAAGLDPDAVLDGIHHHPPDGLIFKDYAAYEPLALAVDRRRIESYYRSRGWFSAKVTDVVVGSADEGVSVRFVVEEGEPSLLETVALEGAPSEVEPVLRGFTDALRIGEPFGYGAYEEVKAKLRQTLVSHGFVYAEVSGKAEVDRDRHQVRALYSIDPGPAVKIGKIKVEGLDLLPEDFVLDRCALAVGDRFDPELLDVTRGRILETGLVESVRFGWEREKRSDTMELVIGVSEGARNEVRFGVGGGHSIGYEVRALASYARKSFFDPRLTLRLTLRPSWAILLNGTDHGGPSIEVGAELVRQDLFLWPRLVGTLGVEYRVVQFEAFTTNGPSASVGLGRPFLDDRLRAELRIQYDHFAVGNNFETALAAGEIKEGELESVGLVSPLRVLSFAPSLAYDGRDDPIDTRFGFLAALRAEIGETFGLGAYATLTPELRGYVPLFWRRLVLAGRARFGMLLFAETTLPITRRYFAGGSESQRGFGRNQLAPSLGTSEPLPVGGNWLLEANAELRLDLFKLFGSWLGIVGFADGADVVARFASLDPLNLHWAVGGGLRYRTPIGAIRIDFGVRVNRYRAGEPAADQQPWAFNFNLGEAF